MEVTFYAETHNSDAEKCASAWLCSEVRQEICELRGQGDVFSRLSGLTLFNVFVNSMMFIFFMLGSLSYSILPVSALQRYAPLYEFSQAYDFLRLLLSLIVSLYAMILVILHLFVGGLAITSCSLAACSTMYVAGVWQMASHLWAIGLIIVGYAASFLTRQMAMGRVKSQTRSAPYRS